MAKRKSTKPASGSGTRPVTKPQRRKKEVPPISDETLIPAEVVITPTTSFPLPFAKLVRRTKDRIFVLVKGSNKHFYIKRKGSKASLNNIFDALEAENDTSVKVIGFDGSHSEPNDGVAHFKATKVDPA